MEQGKIIHRPRIERYDYFIDRPLANFSTWPRKVEVIVKTRDVARKVH